MWKLGNFEIDSRVVLAPMAGYTFKSYREFMAPFGAGVTVTEMVSDMGLIYGNKETKEYIDFEKRDFLTGVQLFGHDPETIKKAAEIALNLNNYIDFFDVNMGCPVPKVTETGAGSSLMKNPRLCGDIIRAIKSVIDKPVTAKIRLGWDNNSINFLEVIDELTKAGVDMIAIHARTKKELYLGTPHFELLKDLRSKMKVPLVVSGNIFTLDDALSAIEITGADAVMVARGAVGNPYLLKQIDNYFKTGERLSDPSLKEQLEWCKTLGEEVAKDKG
ncbi:MAG: tRNA-dihydrouridine synthase family protein, partial [Bacilli bacterium]|nr:tRNA-dihydrouridine synthase family protein [Bacilli bacterium]